MGAKRRLKKQMDIYLKKYPVLALTGPRQSGKTTFLRKQFPGYTYVNLEDSALRNYAIHDPKGFLLAYNRFVIFDEVQRVPQLFSDLQARVDEDGIMGQYILSGSQNFQLMSSITQSLAGRVALFKLLPFDIQEMKQAGWLDPDYAVNLQKGFYPGLYNRNIAPKFFYSNYLQTYVERDLTELIQVKDLKQFRNFISLCAARVGQLLNLNSLANECGISQPTAKSWISVLETSYIIYLLQPYHANLNKRITKSAKLYFYDTGLLCYLLKINDAASLKTNRQKGNLFENFVI
ncbi:MAG: ATP-binding protein, partial [Chitinophagia bacterium]|nr:ATP-binding protein [Chitinophagia bacterium]